MSHHARPRQASSDDGLLPFECTEFECDWTGTITEFAEHTAAVTRASAHDGAVELDGGYEVSIVEGRLFIYGCDCRQQVPSVAKATEIRDLIDGWISRQ